MPTVYIAGDGPGIGVTVTATGLASLLGSNVTLAKAASFRSPDSDSAFHRLMQPNATPPSAWPIALASSEDLSGAISSLASQTLPDGLVLVEGISGCTDRWRPASRRRRHRGGAGRAGAASEQPRLSGNCGGCRRVRWQADGRYHKSRAGPRFTSCAEGDNAGISGARRSRARLHPRRPAHAGAYSTGCGGTPRGGVHQPRRP